MSCANGSALRKDDPPTIRFSDRSFVLASDLPSEERRALEHQIEARGGTIHPFLNAVTDVLAVGPAEGSGSGAQWAREQVRRGRIYRARWGHLEFVTEEALRAALGADPGETGGA